jgi:hypothetical protein
MEEEKKPDQSTGGKEGSRIIGIHSVKDILDGTLLVREAVVKQLPFVLFLTFLALLLIANRYHAERVVRQTDRLQTELTELRAEAISVASQYNRLNKQSEVIKLMNKNGIDLEESVEPPKKLKDK